MKKQIGFTLIELMVAMTIGLIVVAATIAIYISTIRGSSDIVKSAQLNYDIDSALALMVNDLRRAGYWGGSRVGSDATLNPFTQATTDLYVDGSCVLYSYDADEDGVVATDGSEFFGFKRTDTNNIQMRLSGSNTTDCGQGTWVNMNISQGQAQISVSNLQFNKSFNCIRTPQPPPDSEANEGNSSWVGSDCESQIGSFTGNDLGVETREVTVSIAATTQDGQMIQLNPVINGVQNPTQGPYRVKIRNDRIFLIP